MDSTFPELLQQILLGMHYLNKKLKSYFINNDEG